MRHGKFAAACLALLPLVLHAQEDWIRIASTRTDVWEARRGSFELSLTERSREPIGVILIRQRNLNTLATTFEKNYVRLSDCRAGMGKIVTTDLEGQAKYQNDFVLSGGNIASSIADIICLLAKPEGANVQERIQRPTY